MTDKMPTIAVVIPCYQVCDHVLDVVHKIGPEISKIYIVDDCCPDNSGNFVETNCSDIRVSILRNKENLGVGGAVITGYKAALAEEIDIIVKLDGDGQMDPELIPDFVSPIITGDADYTKGNRFFDLEKIGAMPKMRLFGNAVLSFLTKLSSGYWDIFDPTNGYTAIHSDVARLLPLNKISRRYFFESDMLFRLYTLRAVVIDIPIDANYGNEASNLKISRIVGEFLFKHIRNFWKRVFYNYYLRDMSLASIELPLGITLFLFGIVFGTFQWLHSVSTNIPSSAGTVMLSALPIIIGLQLILAFLGHDIQSVPNRSLHRRKHNFRVARSPAEPNDRK